jgi:hypothetical protein
MSRNSKNARLIREAKEMGKNRQAGNKGPSRTNPVHGKKNAWWQKFSSYSAFITGGKGQRGQQKVEVKEEPAE